MSKVLRKLMAQELQKSLENVDSFILITYDKLNSENTYILRSAVRENKMSLKVLKNSLAAITFQNLYNID
ncbi:MAG TPA: 50S ribosomal protein L10, partial [Planctomycetota bacterium]|nr:50S ribosomal protein L10 [Planctomycetota bacterium]